MADLSIEVPGGHVSAILEGPVKATHLVVLAHGAGGDMRGAFMEHFASGLAGHGLRVCRFNFLYTEAGRKAPDKAEVLESTFMGVVEALSKETRGRKVIVGGKSMGGRIASQCVTRGMEPDGLFFLGYPLHPPGRPERIRDAHLYELRLPILFVEGTRDPFCPLETLEGVLGKMKPRPELVVIDDGDHSFKVRRSSGRDTEAAWDQGVDAVARWAQEI